MATSALVLNFYIFMTLLHISVVKKRWLNDNILDSKLKDSRFE